MSKEKLGRIYELARDLERERRAAKLSARSASDEVEIVRARVEILLREADENANRITDAGHYATKLEGDIKVLRGLVRRLMEQVVSGPTTDALLVEARKVGAVS